MTMRYLIRRCAQDVVRSCSRCFACTTCDIAHMFVRTACDIAHMFGSSHPRCHVTKCRNLLRARGVDKLSSACSSNRRKQRGQWRRLIRRSCCRTDCSYRTSCVQHTLLSRCHYSPFSSCCKCHARNFTRFFSIVRWHLYIFFLYSFLPAFRCAGSDVANACVPRTVMDITQMLPNILNSCILWHMQQTMVDFLSDLPCVTWN